MEDRIKGSILFVFLNFFLISFIAGVGSDPLYPPVCRGSIADSHRAFEANRKSLLSVLLANAGNSNGFYNDSTAGNGVSSSGQANGLFLCRGDLSAASCYDSVRIATEDIVNLCPNATDATIWYPECMLRYSNQTISPSTLDYSNPYRMCSSLRLSSSVRAQFKKVLSETMYDIADQAAQSKSGKKFAVKEVTVSEAEKETVYAFVQCIPDLSASDCWACLNSSITGLAETDNCEGRKGGRYQYPSCNIRYEDYRFYNTAGSEGSKGNRTFIIAISVSGSAILLLVLALVGFYICRSKKKRREKVNETSQEVQLLGVTRGTLIGHHHHTDQTNLEDLPTIQLDLILAATSHFSEESMLGEGGFGAVYKGTLLDGREIAVKRLSGTSGQGLQELKNEVTLIAKLQHKNLVRLVGCCLEGNESLLIYEYMFNKSLDLWLFDSTKSTELDWNKRLLIINGIARGILYLHEDSRLKIIHRDLKASNVLLDHEMNPKISDFGMARIFGGDQSQANTKRVVGTYGYMAPEYAMEGLFSVKSDVFSFGVLLLEIISGKRNSGFHLSEQGHSLLTFAWKLWSEGQAMELVDPLLVDSSQSEVLKCIHIGLLCVQEDPADRPTMSSVVVMLASSKIELPHPSEPAFSVGRLVLRSSNQPTTSTNEASLSEILPR